MSVVPVYILEYQNNVFFRKSENDFIHVSYLVVTDKHILDMHIILKLTRYEYK